MFYNLHFYFLGSAYALTGRFQDAINSFSNAIECDPTVAGACVYVVQYMSVLVDKSVEMRHYYHIADCCAVSRFIIPSKNIWSMT